MNEIAEPDWKRWRALTPVVLNRYCDEAVKKASSFASAAGTGHERFLALYRFVGESNDSIAAVFDDPRRSNALFKIMRAVSTGIMSQEELATFSEELQARVRGILDIARS